MFDEHFVVCPVIAFVVCAGLKFGLVLSVVELYVTLGARDFYSKCVDWEIYKGPSFGVFNVVFAMSDFWEGERDVGLRKDVCELLHLGVFCKCVLQVCICEEKSSFVFGCEESE